MLSIKFYFSQCAKQKARVTGFMYLIAYHTVMQPAQKLPQKCLSKTLILDQAAVTD